MTKECGDIFQAFMRAGVADSKGRQVGFIVNLTDNGETFYASVQKGIALKGGDFKKFGAYQRFKPFKTHEAAKAWAYATAKERIAKLKA